MPNSIALAQKYSPILDEIYMRESLSAILDTPSDLVQFVGANTARVFKTEVDGLGTTDRNGHYVPGSVTSAWETYTLAWDRNRSLEIDAMDDEETLSMAFGANVSEFYRTKLIPEVDAYTFAKICGTTGIQTATAADIGSVSDILAAIDTAQQALDDKEVPYEGRILFVSPAAYYKLKGKVTRYLANEETVQRNIYQLDDMRVIMVPSARFNTAIDLLDGKTSGQTAGGYSNVPGTGYSYPINFLLIHPSAVMKIMKRMVSKVISPEVNQDADAWKFAIRAYGDTFVKDNKVKGIYLHRGATANS